MQYRTDERSGNELSALGYGCMRFPARFEDTERLVLRAIEEGVNYFDTAYTYGGSEETLGKIVAKHGLRDKLLIATKLPHGKCRSAADFDRLFDTSLTRLQTNHVDYFLIHNIVSLDQWQRVVDLGIEAWIARRRDEGSIRQVGFSFHGSISEFKKVVDAYDWDFVQIQYNYANERYQAGREGLELAASRGLPVIIMEPLLGGKLATGLPRRAQALFEAVAPGRSAAEWSLRWLWNQPEVTVVLSGMNAQAQLEDNVQAANTALPGSFSPEEQAIIDEVLAEFQRTYRVPCTGCNYCMPCPQGISIPSAFAAYNESFTISRSSGFFHHMVGVGAGGTSIHLAGDCVQCGACVKKCPQHIDVPTELARVRKRLEPGPMRPMLSAFGALMNR